MVASDRLARCRSLQRIATEHRHGYREVHYNRHCFGMSTRSTRSDMTAEVNGLTAIALQVGTGGAQTEEYYRRRGAKGYPFVPYDPIVPIGEAIAARTSADDLSHVRAVLHAAVTDLAYALQVSRQTIYDWQNGQPVNPRHASQLADLARAADVFAAEGLTTSAQLLRRPINSGKRLFDIAREGGSAEDAARKLIDMVRREARQRQILAERLAGRTSSAVPSEI